MSVVSGSLSGGGSSVCRRLGVSAVASRGEGRYLVRAIGPECDTREVDSDGFVKAVCRVAADVPEHGTGVDHGKACFVLVFTQPAPGDLSNLRQLGQVLGLVAAVMHKKGGCAGLAISANERAGEVVDFLEWCQQDDAS